MILQVGNIHAAERLFFLKKLLGVQSLQQILFIF